MYLFIKDGEDKAQSETIYPLVGDILLRVFSERIEYQPEAQSISSSAVFPYGFIIFDCLSRLRNNETFTHAYRWERWLSEHRRWNHVFSVVSEYKCHMFCVRGLPCRWSWILGRGTRQGGRWLCVILVSTQGQLLIRHNKSPTLIHCV